VVLPESTEEVAAVVRWCGRRGIPYVPRGAGTGLSGGALPCEDCVTIELARMRRILEVSVPDRHAHVEVGVVNLDLSRAVEGTGLFYAPDPSSQSACTIGGNIAENSGGPHCMKYGMTTRHVLGLKMVLPDGSVTVLGGPAATTPGYDLTGLVVGSEGTFGVITEAWVRLTRTPPFVRLLFFAFRDMDGACRCVSRLVAEGIEAAALEMIDARTIQVVEDSIYAAGLPREAAAVLLCELDGLEAEVEADTRAVRQIADACGAFETRMAEDAAERQQLWRGRKAAFGALGRLKPDLYVQDAVVPRSRLPEVLRAIAAIARKYDVLLSNVFHAGDGNLHPNISYDGRDPHEEERVSAAGREILETCIALGGALSGEHGIGREKRDFMPMLFSPADLEVFGKVREVFNPRGLCNPDKVLPSAKVCAEFKEGSWFPEANGP
jgi:glycolate oxidase subunit GlcD